MDFQTILTLLILKPLFIYKVKFNVLSIFQMKIRDYSYYLK